MHILRKTKLQKISLKNFYLLSENDASKKVLERIKPESLHIRLKKLPVIDDLFSNITYGQKQLICKFQGNEYQSIKNILSIIYQPLYYNCKFDLDKAERFETLIDKCCIYECYPIAKYYFEQIRKINEKEDKHWSVPPDQDSLAAGIEELNKWSEHAIISKLTQGNLFKHNDAYDLPYYLVFNEMGMRADQAKFEIRIREYLKNKEKKLK